jgi:hypothetical protein
VTIFDPPALPDRTGHDLRRNRPVAGMIPGTFRKTLTLGTVEGMGDPSRAPSRLNGWPSVRPNGSPGAGCAVREPANPAAGEDTPSLPARPSGLPSRMRCWMAGALIVPKPKRHAWLAVRVRVAPPKDIRLRQAILRAPDGASVLIGARDHSRQQVIGAVRSGPGLRVRTAIAARAATPDRRAGPMTGLGGFLPDGRKPIVVPHDPCPAPKTLSDGHPAPGRLAPT